jgi:hypothetical protein
MYIYMCVCVCDMYIVRKIISKIGHENHVTSISGLLLHR